MKSSNNLNFLDRIRRDLKVFVERGIITNIQEDSILEYYGVPKIFSIKAIAILDLLLF